MRIAIVSDIHGNLEALERVLVDIASQACDRVVCLGDMVGYGPNPRECVDLVSRMDACVLGNHDYGALIDPEGFSATAEQAIFWTRRELETGPDQEQTRARLSFLAGLPRVLRDENLLFVHGSVRNPLNEYVFPEDIQNRRKMEKLFSMLQGYCFQGHTHVPGVFTADMTFLRPEETMGKIQLSSDKAMINVGSVGQPRDGDWRACYVVYEAGTVEYRRVEYDVAITSNKIFAIPDLDNFLGERLREGR
ncbi:MAG: metallophosphoesterase family protein [Pirellulaceae bacterium]|nr:metallophosphoesterase family protein [Pirellulaceae bacterium]